MYVNHFNDKNISVVGLGKLGACVAACFAYRGYNVTGLDINQDFVNLINLGKAPVLEPRLQELINSAKNQLNATNDYNKIINDTDVTIIIVPTPSEENGKFSDRLLRDAIIKLSESLKHNSKNYHLFVVASTVSPQTCEESLIPLIENETGRKINNGFGFCYNPEFIALGSVIQDTLNPDLILIGESDKNAGAILEKICANVVENKPQVSRMSLVSAEIAKISLNAFVTMKISFANNLANICDKVQGANVDDITNALGADRRVSPHYLRGGMAFGGPCFPRDNRAFSKFASDYGVNSPLAQGTDIINSHQIEYLSDVIKEYVREGDVVGILGLAYKSDTPVIEESPSIHIIDKLLLCGISVTVYDALATQTTKNALGNRVTYNKSLSECILRSNIIVIATNTDEFIQMDVPNDKELIIIDCWRILYSRHFSDKIVYRAIGSL